jgi:hypothetical protein
MVGHNTATPAAAPSSGKSNHENSGLSGGPIHPATDSTPLVAFGGGLFVVIPLVPGS